VGQHAAVDKGEPGALRGTSGRGVVVPEEGQITEEGSPEELIRQGGRFAALVELEAAGWHWRAGF